MKNKITVLIPVHNIISETIETINSLKKQKTNNFDVIFIVKNDDKIIKEIKLFNIGQIHVKDGNTSYQEMINFGVSKVKTEFFTILEYDDILYDNYIYNFYKYKNEIDFDMALNLVCEVYYNKEGIKNANKLMNESVYSLNVAENIKYWDIKNLKTNGNFSMSNAIINTKSFIDVGGFKKNIEIWHNLEFALRYCHYGYNIFVIPKIMSEHLINRNDSYLDVCSKNISIEKQNMYFKKANEQYIFKKEK